MFLVEEIEAYASGAGFQADAKLVRDSLAAFRLGAPVSLPPEHVTRMSYFVESVLASAPSWEGGRGEQLCEMAGEASEILADVSSDPKKARRLRLRAALLHELSGQPGISSSLIGPDDGASLLGDMLRRRGVFGPLASDARTGEGALMVSECRREPLHLAEHALLEDALRLARYEAGELSEYSSQVAKAVGKLSTMLSIGFTMTEISALGEVLRRRSHSSLRAQLDAPLFKAAKDRAFPAALYPAQVEAISKGLLRGDIDGWGYSAPTGTGKTFLTRILVLQTLMDIPDGKILYIVPSRALVYEVAKSLREALGEDGSRIVTVNPSVVPPADADRVSIEQASVAVLTPEKADLLLRLGSAFISSVRLVIIDEAHHIEVSTRGVLLEMYLARLRKLLGGKARFVLLSAVAPNVPDLAAWLGKTSGGATVDRRTTRFRLAVYRQESDGGRVRGWLDYDNKSRVCLIPKVSKTEKKSLVMVAQAVSSAGQVLILCKGKGQCETLAREMHGLLSKAGTLPGLSPKERDSPEYRRLDSRLERETYSEIGMRELLRHRIGYHHAGLPPRVRIAVEEAVRAGLVRFLFATTTLAEGVNFPFATVIIQSLVLKEGPEKGKASSSFPMSPRTLWNIAGRAGRPGQYKEGLVILFDPEKELNRIGCSLNDYLVPSLSKTAPVKSALAETVREVKSALASGQITNADLTSVRPGANLSKRVYGTINVLRTSIMHHMSTKQAGDAAGMLDETYAHRVLSADERAFASQFLGDQVTVVKDFVPKIGLPLELLAELGLSLDTVEELSLYVRGLLDWQLKSMTEVVSGGRIRFDRAKYVVGPVAKRMAELEGPKLGGFYSNLIMQWFSGVPLSAMTNSPSREKRPKGQFERLISVLYSRIQYLLPWGLYAMDRLVQDEAGKRNIDYGNEIRSLAWLADAGVPGFDALRLTALDFERVDATRLAAAYTRAGGQYKLGADIIGWLKGLSYERAVGIVRGEDKRGVDFDFPRLMEEIRGLVGNQ